jgi:hypothetical protein
VLGRILALIRGPARASIVIAAAVLAVALGHFATIEAMSLSQEDADVLSGSGSASLNGRLLDSHGEPPPSAESQPDGTFMLEVPSHAGGDIETETGIQVRML